MRNPALILASVLAACSIPGIAPEGRDVRITHQEIPASPAQVLERATQILARNGYTIASSSPAQSLIAEKRLGEDLINVIETTVSGTATATRLELHGWTDISSARGRRKAAQYDPSVGRDVQALSQNLSCPSAQWAGCP